MVVMRERPEAVQDLIEEVLGMEVLHHLPVYPVAHAADAIAVDLMNGIRQRRSRPHQETSILVTERALAHHRNGAPGTSAPPDGADQQVRLNRRTLVSDEAGQRVEVPFPVPWLHHQQV